MIGLPLDCYRVLGRTKSRPVAVRVSAGSLAPRLPANGVQLSTPSKGQNGDDHESKNLVRVCSDA